MAFAKRGFHTFCDPLSRVMWGGSVRDELAGDLAIALESQPVAGEPRDKCLRFHSVGGAGTGCVKYPIHYLPHLAPRTSGGLVKSFGTMWVRVRALVVTDATPASGAIAVFEWQHGDAVVYRVSVNFNGTLDLSTGASGSGTLTSRGTGPTPVAFGEWFEIILAVDQASATATLKLMRESDSGYSTEVAATTIPTPSAVATLALGPTANTFSGAGETSIYIDGFSTSDRSEDDVLGRYTIAGSGCRDVAGDSLALAMVVPDGLFAATHARVQYSTDSGLASPSATSFVALSGASHSVLPLPISGLTAGTRYYYRFQVATADDAGSVIWSSDIYTARTLRGSSFTPGKWAFGVTSCNVQSGLAHPYDIEEKITEQADADGSDWLGIYHIGDQGYEGDASGSRGLETDYGSAETTDDFQQMLREFVCDHAYEDKCHRGMFLGLPDDHQIINDSDGRMRPGGSLASTLANSFSGVQGTYSATITCGELYINGMAVFDSWYCSHYINPPTAGERYKSWVDGDARIVLIDTRTERIPGSGQVSATQLAWIKSEVDAFASSATERWLFFVSNGGWNAKNTKPAEGWERLNAAQYYNLITYIDANLPSTKRACILRGDDHCGYLIQQRHETASDVLATNPALGPECVFSGVAIGTYSSSDGPDVLARYPIGESGYPGSTDMMRVSGGLITIDDAANTVNAKAWSPENTNLNHTVVSLIEPPASVVPNSYNAAKSTGLLRGWYSLGETSGTIASDDSFNLRDGVYTEFTGGLKTAAGPKPWLSSAVDFRSTAGRVTCPSGAAVGGASPRLYAGYVYISSFDTAAGKPIADFGQNGADSGRAFMFFAEDGSLSLAFNGHRVIAPKDILSTNTWYHVAMRVPPGATTTGHVEIWINGVKQSLTNEAGSPVALNTVPSFQLGWRPSTGATFDGMLAEWKSYDTGFASDVEVAAVLAEIMAGPEPLNVTAPVLHEDGTVTSGTWDDRNNGTISRTTTLYLASGDSVVTSSSDENPDFSGFVTPGLSYYVIERASNDGGYDEAEDTASAVVEIVGEGEPDPAEGTFSAVIGLDAAFAGSIDTSGAITAELALGQEFTGSKSVETGFAAAFALSAAFTGSSPAMPGEGAFVAELGLSSAIHTQRDSAGTAEFGFWLESHFAGYHVPQSSFAIGFAFDAAFAGPVTIPTGTKYYFFSTATDQYAFQTS